MSKSSSFSSSVSDRGVTRLSHSYTVNLKYNTVKNVINQSIVCALFTVYQTWKKLFFWKNAFVFVQFYAILAKYGKWYLHILIKTACDYHATEKKLTKNSCAVYHKFERKLVYYCNLQRKFTFTVFQVHCL